MKFLPRMFNVACCRNLMPTLYIRPRRFWVLLRALRCFLCGWIWLYPCPFCAALLQSEARQPVRFSLSSWGNFRYLCWRRFPAPTLVMQWIFSAKRDCGCSCSFSSAFFGYSGWVIQNLIPPGLLAQIHPNVLSLPPYT